MVPQETAPEPARAVCGVESQVARPLCRLWSHREFPALSPFWTEVHWHGAIGLVGVAGVGGTCHRNVSRAYSSSFPSQGAGPAQCLPLNTETTVRGAANLLVRFGEGLGRAFARRSYSITHRLTVVMGRTMSRRLLRQLPKAPITM